MGPNPFPMEPPGIYDPISYGSSAHAATHASYGSAISKQGMHYAHYPSLSHHSMAPSVADFTSGSSPYMHSPYSSYTSSPYPGQSHYNPYSYHVEPTHHHQPAYTADYGSSLDYEATTRFPPHHTPASVYGAAVESGAAYARNNTASFRPEVSPISQVAPSQQFSPTLSPTATMRTSPGSYLVESYEQVGDLHSVQPQHAGPKHKIFGWMKQSRGGVGGGRKKNIKQEIVEERHSPESRYYKTDLTTAPAPPVATAPMGSPNSSSGGSREGYDGKFLLFSFEDFGVQQYLPNREKSYFIASKKLYALMSIGC